MISIVIPAYNEETRLPGTISKINSFRYKYPYMPIEIIVVPNGCTDRTADIARWHLARVIEVQSPGKGLAIRAGVEAARGDYVYICDADLSTPIDTLGDFLAILTNTNSDIVIGSREAKGARRYNEPMRRHIAGRVFNLLIRAMTGLPYSDTQCGFKLFTIGAIKNINCKCRINGFAYDVEVLYLARIWGYKVTELPVSWYADGHSTVHLWRDSWRMARDILRITINERYSKNVPTARTLKG